MLLAHIFNAKVIYHERECNGARDMFPQAWCVWQFEVSLFGQALFEELVGKDACLRKSVHALGDGHVHKAILCFVIKFVFIAEFLGDEADVHLHVLLSIQWCLQVEALDVSSHVLGIWCANDAVPHQFSGSEVGRTGG